MDVKRTLPCCYLIGAGNFGDGIPQKSAGDLVIAGDGGYQACMDRGISPDLIIGDFDSLGYVPETETEVTVLPVEKDDTDMRAAMELGWDRGYRRFVIYGGTGGRISHTLANIALMEEISIRGGQAMMVGCSSRYHVIRGVPGSPEGCFSFGEEASGDVSVFCLGDRALGVTITGLKYELKNAVLVKEFPLGVSNSYIGRAGEIRVSCGDLLIVEEYRKTEFPSGKGD